MIYLVVGNGRLAKHLLHYFKLLNLPSYHWHYQNHPLAHKSLAAYLEHIKAENFCDQQNINIFVLIKDSAITSFIENNMDYHSYQNIFHCSGALTTDLAIRLHPLMTFSSTLYDRKTYISIPFVTCRNQHIHSLSQLPNPIYNIPSERADLYHALCVLIGNFTQILWQRASQEMEQKLQLPKEIIHLYLQQVVNNYTQSPSTCLTGPLVRNDSETINNNLHALESVNMNLFNIYQDLIKLYHEQY